MNAEKKGRLNVSEEKKKLVENLLSLIENNPLVGMVNMQNLPAKQLTRMRSKLRGKVNLLMTKKRFIRMALKNSKKKGVSELETYLKGMPALLFTDQNPFTLFKLLKKNKSTAPIKPGQEAPQDIVIPAGPTSFAPGPIIGDLGSLHIKAGVENGKVAIKQDSVAAKEGDVVSEKLAGILTRLGIEPMEIGLDLVAVYENGEILTKDVLDVDEEAYINNIKTAASESFNLAMFAGYANKDTIELLLSKAHNEAKAVSEEANIMTSDNVGELLSKAEAQASALKSRVPEAAEKKEEPKQENKEAEEKKQEEPKEEEKEEKKTEETKEEQEKEPEKEEGKDDAETKENKEETKGEEKKEEKE